jgi:hypothetical protein
MTTKEVPFYREEAALMSMWRTFSGGVAKATKAVKWVNG